jgi:ABC-type multidrug transport system permease subunit
MSKQVFALATATVCAGLGVYFMARVFKANPSGPVLPWAFGLFAVSLGFVSWAVFSEHMP